MKKKVLAAIDRNSKLTAKELALMLGSNEEEIIAFIEEMERGGIICGYPTLINWDKIENEKVTALIEVKVTPQRGEGFDRVAERIYKFEEVEAVYLMSGSYDLTVMIEGKSMKEIAHFVSMKLAAMDSVLSTVTHFVLKKYKEHGIPLVHKKKDERMLISP